MSSLTLLCPSCGGRTVFSLETDTFICEYCGNQHVFNLPTRQAARAAAAAPTAPVSSVAQPPQKALLPRPREVKIEKKGQSVQISWRWFSPKYIPLVFFCVAWDGFLCFWYSMAFSSQGAPWIMFVFPIVHLAVGVGLTYSTLAGFLNTSTLRIDKGMFTVWHDPMPWPGEVKVPIANLAQLYCKEKVSYSRRDSSAVTYQLCAILKDGRKLDLLSNLESAEVATFMEQQIESWLRIEDIPVVGER